MPDRQTSDAVVRRIIDGEFKAVFVMDDNPAHDPALAEALSRLDFLVVQASNENETTRLADVVFPAATYAERHGTFTNFQGRVQRIRPSVATLEVDRAMEGFAMSRLDRFGTAFDRWGRGIKRDARASWQILAGIASVMGFKYRYATAEDVFAEIASTQAPFRGMNYQTLGNRGLMLGVVREQPVRS